jgi:hypothetical protein
LKEHKLAVGEGRVGDCQNAPGVDSQGFGVRRDLALIAAMFYSFARVRQGLPQAAGPARSVGLRHMQRGGSAGKIAQPDNGQKRFEVTDKKNAGVFLDTLSALAYKEIKKTVNLSYPVLASW